MNTKRNVQSEIISSAPYILFADYDLGGGSLPRVRNGTLNSVAFPQFSQSPPSSVSTENTLIALESVPSGSSQNLKRNREEHEGTVEDTERPAVRSRTESYVPPEEEVTGPLGLLLLPFKSFARGFRESLKNGS